MINVSVLLEMAVVTIIIIIIQNIPSMLCPKENIEMDKGNAND